MKSWPDQTDEDLMRAYCLGEADAFAELYRRHSGRVYAYLKKRLSSREEVDEVFQLAFLKAHQSRHGFDFKYPFAQWLYVITKTTLLDHWRRQGRSLPLVEIDGDLSQIEDPRTLEQEGSPEILEHLSSEQRQVIEMRVFDELSYPEIAAKLGRSEDGVRQILSRALKKLRLEWKEPKRAIPTEEQSE